ncbi:hypothetical protein [Flexibacterium corallicola]|uniref:hypothetical protein n=1 Tax=Flexibacterium corallicola TaxID=3037259 RepID=UPI00286F6C71|nr:hypothetical protein [Pseudovibrio sp. M1P-2-3]
MNKLIYPIFLSLLTVSAPYAQPLSIPIVYEQFSQNTPEALKYWGKSAMDAEGTLVSPSIFVGNVPVGSILLTVTMLAAPSVCGLNECPVRIFKDDKMLASFNSCDNVMFHSLSQSGYFFRGCDDIYPTGLVKHDD